MKNILIFVFALFLFSSCGNDLSKELKTEIIKYQENIPLPKKGEIKDKNKFLYVIKFEKKENDTLFNLIRCPSLSKYDKVSGIYEDNSLKPFAIIDPDKLGEKILYTPINKNVSSYINSGTHFKEDYPPLYRYKIKNKKIRLISIDTISYKWAK